MAKKPSTRKRDPNETRDSVARDLLKVLKYCPDTGFFQWTVWAPGQKKDKPYAGSVNSRGYIMIYYRMVPFAAHRLAILATSGEWPVNTIDHINGNRQDNRLCNLRDITQAGNMQNIGVLATSKTGLPGMYFNNGRWVAQIKSGGVKHYLGRFDSPELAHAAYIQAKARMHTANPTVPMRETNLSNSNEPLGKL